MTSALLAIKINIDPVIAHVIGLEITWHGLFTALGVVIGVAIATWFARKAGYQEDTIYNVALALVIGGIIGARALYVLEHTSLFKDDPGDIFAINTGGISIYGALIGGTIGGWLYAFIRKVPNLPRGADIAAIGGIVGMAVGRIGDIINGEHFASSTSLPWGVLYTNGNSPSFLAGFVDPQHPAVAYELIGDLVIFLALTVVYLRVQRAGVTFFAWIFLYGLLRTLVSFLRLDDVVLVGLRTAQLIGIAAQVLGIGGIVYLLAVPPREERTSRAQRRRLVREEEPATEEQTAG
ncbi:MAG: prolipoprotein diacylglyceryl transferase [Dehalococcoidia bacterium]|nr:prolipoprotein diacylglyceryl transferase [Dehalococcoidia bacterium]